MLLLLIECAPAAAVHLQVLRHAGSTSGLAWHPTNTCQLATTSEAGPVYVWDLKLAGDSCLLQTLAGHSKRSFSVAWSPLLSGLLLSGSDDATARVWDVQSGTCVALLLGHVTEVRALCWHPEVPWLVFTGERNSRAATGTGLTDHDSQHCDMLPQSCWPRTALRYRTIHSHAACCQVQSCGGKGWTAAHRADHNAGLHLLCCRQLGLHHPGLGHQEQSMPACVQSPSW